MKSETARYLKRLERRHDDGHISAGEACTLIADYGHKLVVAGEHQQAESLQRNQIKKWRNLADFEFLEMEGIKKRESTSLLDLRGVEIFDGDIITGCVIFDDDPFGNTFELICPVKHHGYYIYPFSVPRGGDSGFLAGCEIIASEFEVIGNIYQNPELIDKFNDKE